MSNQGLRLTVEQISYIMDITEIDDAHKAIIYLAEVMRKEGIGPRDMPDVVALLMKRSRKRLK